MQATQQKINELVKKAEDEQTREDNQPDLKGILFISNNSELCLLCTSYLGSLQKWFYNLKEMVLKNPLYSTNDGACTHLNNY